MRKYLRFVLIAFILCALPNVLPSNVFAADTPGDFSLQVTPSPLVTSVKPGTRTQVALKIRNAGDGVESLKIEPRSFTFDSKTGKVNLLDTVTPDIKSWVSFSNPTFKIAPGEWVTEQVILNFPKDTGFSYSFALAISRQSNPKPTEGNRAINGSLAVFTLVNIDKPGATSSLNVASFTASKRIYEYLPSTFTVRFRNSGNTIVQPYGNIFIQRGKDTKSPLKSLVVNETRGYILPSTERAISAEWTDGFPVYKTATDSNGKTERKLIWNWGELSKLRIGRYTAHLVAVYNQAGHDVPIEGTVSFWVIPWKILLVLFVVTLLLLFSIYMIGLLIFRKIKHRRQKKQTAKGNSKSPDGNLNEPDL